MDHWHVVTSIMRSHWAVCCLAHGWTCTPENVFIAPHFSLVVIDLHDVLRSEAIVYILHADESLWLHESERRASRVYWMVEASISILNVMWAQHVTQVSVRWCVIQTRTTVNRTSSWSQEPKYEMNAHWTHAPDVLRYRSSGFCKRSQTFLKRLEAFVKTSSFV